MLLVSNRNKKETKTSKGDTSLKFIPEEAVKRRTTKQDNLSWEVFSILLSWFIIHYERDTIVCHGVVGTCSFINAYVS